MVKNAKKRKKYEKLVFFEKKHESQKNSLKRGSFWTPKKGPKFTKKGCGAPLGEFYHHLQTKHRGQF